VSRLPQQAGGEGGVMGEEEVPWRWQGKGCNEVVSPHAPKSLMAPLFVADVMGDTGSMAR